MLGTIRRIIFWTILFLIFLLVGVYFFYYKRNSSSNNSNSQQPLPEKNWMNIHSDFKENALVEQWKSRDFTYQQTQEWINVGLKPLDAPFAKWLRDTENYTPEFVLNYGDEAGLKKDYEIWQKQRISLKDQIIASLYEWLLTDFPTGREPKGGLMAKKDLEKTIQTFKSNLDGVAKMEDLRNLLTSHTQYSKISQENGSYVGEISQNYRKLEQLAQEWEKSINNSSKNDFFKAERNLTAMEIDWATKKINHNLPIKILPANWFNLQKDNQDICSILKEIQTDEELVFIPIQNLNNKHWSLLVLEQDNNLFYHYDIGLQEKGNYDYLEPFLEKTINQMNEIKRQTGNISENFWELYFRKQHIFSLENECDSGIMVVSIVQRIINLYSDRFRLVSETVSMYGNKWTRSKQYLKEVNRELGEFDWNSEREYWKEKYSEGK